MDTKYEWKIFHDSKVLITAETSLNVRVLKMRKGLHFSGYRLDPKYRKNFKTPVNEMYA